MMRELLCGVVRGSDILRPHVVGAAESLSMS